MWDRIRGFLASPIFESEGAANEEKTRAAALINPLLLALFVVCIFGVGAAFVLFANKLGGLTALTVLFFIALFSKVALNRGYIQLASVLLVIGIWIPVSAVAVLSQARSMIN